MLICAGVSVVVSERKALIAECMTEPSTLSFMNRKWVSQSSRCRIVPRMPLEVVSCHNRCQLASVAFWDLLQSWPLGEPLEYRWSEHGIGVKSESCRAR